MTNTREELKNIVERIINGETNVDEVIKIDEERYLHISHFTANGPVWFVYEDENFELYDIIKEVDEVKEQGLASLIEELDEFELEQEGRYLSWGEI